MMDFLKFLNVAATLQKQKYEKLTVVVLKIEKKCGYITSMETKLNLLPLKH